MDDLISRQDAIDAVWNSYGSASAVKNIGSLPSAQPEVDCQKCIFCGFAGFKQFQTAQQDVPDTNVGDIISRQAAIDTLCNNCDHAEAVCPHYPCKQYIEIENLPPAQPTLYGYSVEHLAIIARILQKENLPPERIAEMLSDVGRIVEIVRDEFEETLRKVVEGR